MKSAARFLPLSLVLVALGMVVVHAAPEDATKAPEPSRNALREAVAAHRAERRDEVRREEAAFGRHLSPAELAELREQVRQQWAPRPGRLAAVETRPVAAAGPATAATATTAAPAAEAAPRSAGLAVPAARSQRP